MLADACWNRTGHVLDAARSLSAQTCLRRGAKHKAGKHRNYTSYCGDLSCGLYSIGRQMSVVDALLQQQQPPGDKSDLPDTLCMSSALCMAVSRGLHIWDSAQFI